MITLMILIPSISQAGSPFVLGSSNIINIPRSSFYNGDSNELEISGDYMEDNILEFPSFKIFSLEGRLFYGFEVNDFTTVVSIYQMYRSYPKYYEDLLGFAIDLETKEEENLIKLITTTEELDKSIKKKENYQNHYTKEIKKAKVLKREIRIKTILWAIGGVVLGASLGIVSGVFIEKNW